MENFRERILAAEVPWHYRLSQDGVQFLVADSGRRVETAVNFPQSEIVDTLQRRRLAVLFVTAYQHILSEFSGADGVKVRLQAGNPVVGRSLWST